MSRRISLLAAALSALYLLCLISFPPTGRCRPAPPTPAPTVSPTPDRPPPEIRNETSFSPDLAALEAEPLTQRLARDGAQILILHTHGTEAYSAVPGEEYTPTEPYRTTEADRSVIRVGETLAEALRRQGLTVIHDTGLYDYPLYTGAYERSGNAVRGWLERFPSIGVVIDVHRDAAGADQSPAKPLSAANDGAAQVMLLVGTGGNGLEHPHWRENLKLALALQRAMDERSPTLARPLRLVRERYNQQLTTGALLLEVGANGNTLSEAERACELFARAAGPVLLSLVED